MPNAMDGVKAHIEYIVLPASKVEGCLLLVTMLGVKILAKNLGYVSFQ
jgi:hypothetical protein